jgi:hypothetical protein
MVAGVPYGTMMSGTTASLGSQRFGKPICPICYSIT